jgi:hypothetical protein
MAITKINKFPDDIITTGAINNVANADIHPAAAIAQSKVSGLATSMTNLCASLTGASNELTSAKSNVSLLGFKMAVNESLTVFNLIDGVVDEFHDESGTDEGEGSNDLYNATCDYYINATAPDGLTATSTNIFSEPFASTSVATSARIVIFEENVDTPTLNTDIIASVSRDGGSTFTNATLTDAGYVTGASGQRILTGQATISGQPSGQSMRWKLALANNAVKIHGVSLSWE